MPRSKPVAVEERCSAPESEDKGYDPSSADEDVEALDSDNLDDDKGDTANRGGKGGAKRKKGASVAKRKAKKRRRKVQSDDDESDLELKEGQEVVGKVVRAPKTGQGSVQISLTGNH